VQLVESKDKKLADTRVDCITKNIGEAEWPSVMDAKERILPLSGSLTGTLRSCPVLTFYTQKRKVRKKTKGTLEW
jgi:hypothetical protein